MPGLPALPSIKFFYPFFGRAIRIVAILVAALIVTKIADKFIRSLRGRFLAIMTRRAEVTDLEMEKRAATISEILRKALAVAIYVGALMMALREAGFDVRPLLAGAGIVGLAVGFGAQNLVRDIISGIFILLENQIRIDDVAVINGTSGVVEEINLRTIVLRGMDGTVHIFHNGGINTLANMTRGYSYYMFNIRVAYKEDIDRVSAVLKELGAELQKEEFYSAAILEPLEILGIDQFTDTGVILEARFKTLPTKQWMVGREMNRRIKQKFDELGIQMH